MLPLKVCVFSEQGNQTPMKMMAQVIQPPRAPLRAVSSEFCIQNSFKAADWDGPASQNTPGGTLDEPEEFDHYLKFFRNPLRCQHFQTTGSSLENTTPTFPREGVGGFGQLVDYGCLSLFRGIGYGHHCYWSWSESWTKEIRLSDLFLKKKGDIV